MYLGKATALDILCNADPFIEINIIAKVEIEKKNILVKVINPSSYLVLIIQYTQDLCIEQLLFSKIRNTSLESSDTFLS